MKPAPATSAAVTSDEGGSSFDQLLGNLARILFQGLGQQHRQVGGEIAVRWIARGRSSWMAVVVVVGATLASACCNRAVS